MAMSGTGKPATVLSDRDGRMHLEASSDDPVPGRVAAQGGSVAKVRFPHGLEQIRSRIDGDSVRWAGGCATGGDGYGIGAVVLGKMKGVSWMDEVPKNRIAWHSRPKLQMRIQRNYRQELR
ncbi:unnamed protein product [Urochloa humidicola]